MKSLRCLLVILALFVVMATPGFAESAETQKADADFDKLAPTSSSGYLTARPLEGVALGFHQYDGKISDYSRLAIDAEVERLKRFQDRFSKLGASKLDKQADIDRRHPARGDRRRALPHPGHGDLREQPDDLRACD